MGSVRLPALAETQEERDDNNWFLGLPIGEADPLDREPGEPLAPLRFSRKALSEFKRDVGSMGFSAEYQGVPRAPEGNRIKRDWLPIVDAAPRRAKRVRYWDHAATAGGGAYTAGVLMALTDDGLVYIENVIRGQWSSGERQKVQKQTAEIDRARYGGRVKIWFEQEPGSAGKDSARATIKALQGHPVYADRPTGDKDVRLNPLAAQAEAGNVFLARGDWNGDFIDEATTIPNSKYRDQTDAAAGGYNRLTEGTKMRTGKVEWYGKG